VVYPTGRGDGQVRLHKMNERGEVECSGLHVPTRACHGTVEAVGIQPEGNVAERTAHVVSTMSHQCGNNVTSRRARAAQRRRIASTEQA